MKTKCFILIFILSLTGCMDQAKKDNAAILFAKGNKAYQSGDYDAAAKSYEDIVKSGIASGELYYNLGNTYYKEGSIGKAVLNYERARRLIPRDADLKANHRFVLAQVPNWTGDQSSTWLERLFLHMDQVTFNEITLMLGGLFACGCILLAAALIRRWSRGWIFLTTVIFGSIFVYHGLALYVKYRSDIDGAVLIETAEARFEPDKEATAHYTVWEGWKVRILREADGWVKIERPDGRQGWVPATTIQKI